ncbi:antibiotic biosynthesis monooxygenase family protein [Chitinophaga sp. 22620]|jgi:heme oxygenase (mycobilin-producing)|uniref:antibiotic biosynthesis monooxygenase family protein n=1 Tax=Chitinophaga sp. 22620 TaxID=3453952 RepID=UPI003F83F232
MNKHFVAINYIQCNADFRERFEQLFATRAHAIDTMPGFINMHVLRPEKDGEAYLIVSYWETEQAFKDWMKSEAFAAGHRRGFEELAKAKAEGRPAPMSSDFKIYQIISE